MPRAGAATPFKGGLARATAIRTTPGTSAGGVARALVNTTISLLGLGGSGCLPHANPLLANANSNSNT